MHPAALQALVKRIRDFFDLARAEEQRTLRDGDDAPRRTYAHKGRGIELTPALEVEFEKMVDVIAKQEQLGDSFTRETLSQRLINALLESKTEDPLEALVLNVLRGLTRDVKPYRVHVPLGGIILEPGTTLAFGDVMFTTYENDDEFDTAFRRPFRELQRSHTSHERMERDEEQYMEYISALRWRPAVVVNVRTGSDNVRNVIFNRVQPIADYWQFCAGTIMSGRWIPLVDYHMTALAGGIEAFPILAEDGSSMSFPVLPGAAPAVRLSPEYMKHLERLGLVQLMSIFGTLGGDLGDGYDAMLRRAIQNYADGERATSGRQKLLSYAASCELFFTRRKDTTVAVCHGIAKILADDEIGDYNSLYKHAAAMYDARSRTIHEGHTPTAAQVEQYAALAQQAILGMIKRRGLFVDKAALDAWSSPPSPRQTEVARETAGEV